MSANDRQVGGTHYSGDIQTWDFIVANELDYFQGNIIKYVARHKLKGGLEDLQKARHYLDKYIELSEEVERQEESRSTLGFSATDLCTGPLPSVPTPEAERRQTAAELDRMRGRLGWRQGTVKQDKTGGIQVSDPEHCGPQG